jgi:heme exporter protein D
VDAIEEFLSMGGYAAFIWPSFAIAALVLAALLIVSLRGLRARRTDLEALQAAQNGRRGAEWTQDEA